MNTNKKLNVNLYYAFLIFALDGDELPASRPSHFITRKRPGGTLLMESWVERKIN
jgi:hypothetical protein